MKASEGKTTRYSGEVLSDFQDTDLATEFRYKNGISGKQPLRCERVNDITFKITDGKMSRVPAKQGWWAGYDTPRALAWVINVGPSTASWLARTSDQVCGPLSFGEAKATAINLAKGAEGDYRIQNQITHLNGLHLDMGGAA